MLFLRGPQARLEAVHDLDKTTRAHLGAGVFRARAVPTLSSCSKLMTLSVQPALTSTMSYWFGRRNIEQFRREKTNNPCPLNTYQWHTYGHGLIQLPVAA
jgi:hypothetical protein